MTNATRMSQTSVHSTLLLKAGALEEPLSQMLYAARWLGMLLVLGVHASAAFLNFNALTPETTPLFIAAWRFTVNYPYGRLAVIGFFVMSGFLVGGPVLARLKSEKPFLRAYFVHRIVRIYMVVIPAIALTFAVDTIGRTLFPPNYGAYAAFEGHFDPRYILTNLLNLQGVIATHYGSNGPLWSVGYEFWYYMVFPLFLAPLIASLDQKRGIILAALATLFCLAISLRQIWFPFGLALWTLGAWVSVPKQPGMTSTRNAFGLFLFGTVLLGVIFNNDVYHAHPWVQYVSDTGSALLFANLILTMRFSDGPHWRLLDWHGHKSLADFTFTLYAIHNPTLMLLRATTTAVLGVDWIEGAAAPIQWAAFGVAVSLTILLAYALSRFTEGKVDAARRWASAMLDKIWPTSDASNILPGTR
jgi:peptidoglycan/LPS O-acetylase OafA/YrhL